MAPEAKIAGPAGQEGLTVLTELEAKGLLGRAGISVVEAQLVTSKEAAVTVSRRLGFPVVLKVVSPNITHKSDVGGVRLGLKTSRQVARAYDDIMAAVRQRRPQVVIQGISVQRMARPGVEVIIGVKRDTQFGPVLMFGLGGVMVEVIKDVSFRIVPISQRDARQMIREIKGYPLLTGYRGGEAVDIAALEELLVKVSCLVEEQPEIQELDINPVFAYAEGAVAVDARVVLGEGNQWA
jgi:acyl-CoA synthetase (NDP forming)